MKKKDFKVKNKNNKYKLEKNINKYDLIKKCYNNI